MKRHGMLGDFLFEAMWGFSVVLLLAALIAFGVAAEDKAESDVRTFYTDNVVAEEVMGAPCATASRGIFYRSSITTGDFSCLAPIGGPVHIRFNLEGDTYAWTVTGQDGPAEVNPYSGGGFLGGPFSQEYRILVRDGGAMTEATMEVGMR